MATIPMEACEWRVGSARRVDTHSEIRIVERAQTDGSVLYAVTRGGWVANRERGWEIEPQPSSRDDAFIARTRFEDWQDAGWLAQHMAEDRDRFGDRAWKEQRRV